MVTLITIDNEQSLLLGEVHCRSQEKRGKSGTLGERQTNKSLTFVHVTARALCHASGNLVF